ncbi:thiamine pyrophosphate-dependent dehydrogenase E1 component subunit alpha [Streptomyces sp. NPDC048106]|uniref:thiamine pyrophosphate-dependent dehydrogenase E1 component subunit alpha n=1 Tax=Streptomyces sp. NPDC048106 TaxID=3155750 RepID=UPI0034564E21
MTTAPPAATAKVAPEILREIYAVAAKAARYDDRFRSLKQSGKAGGMYYSPRGQEIIPASFAPLLRSDDQVLTIYRGVHDQIAKGVPLRELTAEFLGRATGTCKGKGGPMHVTHPDSGLLVTTGVVGSGLPIGVGVALSAKMRGTDQVTVVNFGDGASNIGAFHEALNLASVWNLPVVFVCQNNRWAEYTSYATGTSVERIADRGAAYSMRSLHVDGNDPEAMYPAAEAAVNAARAGEGPTLIEATTYRFFGHYFGDSMKYMPKEELKQAKDRDPVALLRKRLIDEGHAVPAEVEAIEREIDAEIEDAFAFALDSPQPDLAELHTDVYRNEAHR